MYSEKIKLHDRERNRPEGALRTVVIDVTPKCNMRCPHCYAFLEGNPVELKYVKQALDQAYDLGVSHYVLMGGEPILDMERTGFILSNCHPDESYITVTTNGWSMTIEEIRRLKDLKVDKISVSLDSGIEEEHDANRRPGSFRRVMEVIDNVLSQDLFVSLDVVVTHQSLYLDGFKKVYELAKSKRIRLDLQIAEPVGKWEGRRELLVTSKDSHYIKELQQNSPLTMNGERIIKRDIFSGIQDHCPAGTDFLHITTEGEVFPCNFLQFTLGNIRDTSLRKMRDDLLTHPLFNTNCYPKCLCGEDEEFIDKYLMPYVGMPKPMDAYNIFKLPYGGNK